MAWQVAIILVFGGPVVAVAVQGAAGLGGHRLQGGARLRPILHVLYHSILSVYWIVQCDTLLPTYVAPCHSLLHRSQRIT